MFQELYVTLSPKDLSAPYLPQDLPVDHDAARYLLYGIACCQGTLPAGFHCSFQSFPAFCLLHVGSGAVQYGTFPSSRLVLAPLEAGSLSFFDCRLPHRLECGSAAEYEILYFGGSPAPYYAERFLAPPSVPDGIRETEASVRRPRSLPASPRTLYRLHSLTDAAGEMDCLYRHKLLTDLLTGLLSDCAPARNHVPPYLKQIRNELEKHYTLPHTLGSLETAFQMNRYRICRDFKQYYQTSPIQYLHETRVHISQALLRGTAMKIHEISYEVGYENVNHFISHFKKATGTTPAAYRKHSASYL
ncbi:MAG: AraC family transcriptional regulator [Clostridium sp.]|jgi:AraC-like DNA-binding protein|nr:AraC family transcriptional regulator [Clostridium sp.]